MCGIVGFLNRSSEHDPIRVINAMAKEITHRGPDDGHAWVDADTRLTFGFRRLSILELSLDGRQPMTSPCGRLTVIFNGEIYNHQALREELEARHPYTLDGVRGHSDTAILLASTRAWGFEETLKRLVGMFAIALWDRKEQRLYLARDRAGEKPLYFGWNSGNFLLGSELKAFHAHPQFRPRICEDAFRHYVHFNSVPAPLSIYEDIYKLRPGHFLEFSLEELKRKPIDFDPESSPKSYWDISPSRFELIQDEAEWVPELKTRLSEAIRLQMVADVPVGAFLSGGIDSSLIVALMAEQSSQKVKTFTIGFTEERYNEAHFAKEVSTRLGTDHTELIVTPQMSLDLIPKIPDVYCEPFADSSQIPTLMVSQLARRSVTVSLSGDGGDELFGGYPRYSYAQELQPLVSKHSQLLSQLVGQVANKIPRSLAQYFCSASKWDKLMVVLRSPDFSTIYSTMMTNVANPDHFIEGADGRPLRYLDPRFKELGTLEWMMRSDFLHYLPDDILTKVDRASMGVSLESRAPFLDHRVVELAWRLPHQAKIQDAKGKLILRNLLKQYLPESLMERRKMGFGLPMDAWLRGELRDWAESLLAPNHLGASGLWKVNAVRKRWEEHLKGEQDWAYFLWNVLMFEAWRNKTHSSLG